MSKEFKNLGDYKFNPFDAKYLTVQNSNDDNVSIASSCESRHSDVKTGEKGLRPSKNNINVYQGRSTKKF